MSIRINNHEVGLTSQTGAPDPTKPAGSGRSANSASGRTTEDRIDVSLAAENIHAVLNAQDLQHSNRVAQLGKIVAEGRYHVAAGELSRAIVAGAIVGRE
jgi:anti-sigma28 factor (negative regulator of flagellin synthesis)